MTQKAQQLAEIEGFDDPIDLLEQYVCDSVCPGICMNEGCDYTATVDPDTSRGICPDCKTPTVQSMMIIEGII